MSDLSELMKRVHDIEGRKDSIEIGTPSGTGKLKIYFDAGNPEETEGLIEKAVKALEYARTKHAEPES